MSGTIISEVIGTAAWLRLNRPAAKNAINNAMRSELAAAFDQVLENPAVRCIIITGQDEAFAAGSDIQELNELTGPQSVLLSERIAAFAERIAQAGKPVIAAVNGWCLGGGFELVLACDIRIASESARFGLPEPKLGLIAGGGGIPRLTRIAGPAMARYMSLTAEIIDARTALERGIVASVVAADELEAEATRIAERISTLAPIALAQTKRVLNASEDGSIASAIAIEAQGCAVCIGTEDYKEGTLAFLERRAARFTGK